MLTRSPIPTPRSASASPNFTGGVRYAPSPSPRQSPTRIGSSLSRRQQGGSGLVPAPKPYVGVDASTQYSPMEPVSRMTGRGAPPSRVDTPMREPPPPPEPKPLDVREQIRLEEENSVQSAQDVRSAVEPARSVADLAQHTSPAKRRNSQGPGVSTNAEPSRDTTSLPKRLKPEDAQTKVLPRRYELCSVDDMVVLIANMLGELIETNDALGLKSGHLTRFHSRTAPGISVMDYLQRLAKHATLTQPLLLSMVYYIDRLCSMYPDFTINTLTVHRFLITAATVAAKGLSDSFWNNSTYARVGGVKVTELKLLELEFLYRVDWKIVPNPELLIAYYKGLVDRCPGYTLEPEQKRADEERVKAEPGSKDGVFGVEMKTEKSELKEESTSDHQEPSIKYEASPDG